MTRRTKIVATLGPASNSPEKIRQLIEAGVNVFRLNFSHGDPDQHRQQARNVREAAAEKNRFVALLGDLQGPKIRLGDLAKPCQLINDTTITLTTDSTLFDDSNYIPVKYPPLPASVGSGDTLLLDDGLIRLQVIDVDGKNIACRVVTGGELKSRKGLNRLGGGLSAAAITEKDFGDIALALELGVDFLAVSFPASAADLQPVREKLAEHNSDIRIIAKVERAEVVATDEMLQSIIDAADGIMVARGDLGVEIGDAQLIGIQKKIIRMTRRSNKPVITATQMMESMINSPVPTRAEVFDVANAVLDGTDAVMLSAETATGDYPVEVVKAMADTCLGAEQHPVTRESNHRMDRTFDRTDEAIAMSAIYAANHLDGIVANICLTESGNSALLMSRLSSGLNIFGISRHLATCQRLALYRGVEPLHMDVAGTADTDPRTLALEALADEGALTPGQRVTITYGDISGTEGMTNTLQVLTYEG